MQSGERKMGIRNYENVLSEIDESCARRLEASWRVLCPSSGLRRASNSDDDDDYNIVLHTYRILFFDKHFLIWL